MFTVIRATPFYAYCNAEGVEVMATEIQDAVEVHLQAGLVPYVLGDYELITSEGRSIYMHKDEFESLFKCVETKETLTLHGVSEPETGKKEVIDNVKRFNWRKILGNERGAISLGGAVAPAATPFATDANNPNIRRFNITALDADTGPTAFNHGLSVPAGNLPIAIITLASASATTVVTGNIAATVTATQVTLSKNNLAGSATGLNPVAVLTMWNPHAIIQ